MLRLMVNYRLSRQLFKILVQVEQLFKFRIREVHLHLKLKQASQLKEELLIKTGKTIRCQEQQDLFFLMLAHIHHKVVFLGVTTMVASPWLEWVAV